MLESGSFLLQVPPQLPQTRLDVLRAAESQRVVVHLGAKDGNLFELGADLGSEGFFVLSQLLYGTTQHLGLRTRTETQE